MFQTLTALTDNKSIIFGIQRLCPCINYYILASKLQPVAPIQLPQE